MLNKYRNFAIHRLATLGPRILPFADVASDDLPLGKLLRLSLFQVTVGMALVLLVGTLNRVMIVELSVPASIVGIMISLPLVFAPFRALIGFKSDVYVSALGWRRVPFIWRGSMYQFGGFALMPFALLVLSGYMDAATLPPWVGIASAALAFLLVGIGAHMVQTVGLALATDLAPPENQAKVVGLMYVMLLIGMMVSALIFGALLADYTPGRMIQVIQGAALLTVTLNLIAVWKQEPRDRGRASRPRPNDDFKAAWRSFIIGDAATSRLVVIALGTLGFGMADVLLEPYGGQVLGLSVASTTRLTATFAIGGLVGFGLASRVLSRVSADPMRLALFGLAVGVPAFGAIIASGVIQSLIVFLSGTFLVGFGTGLFAHGTLTATMRSATREQTGLALGTWGAVQATAAGIAVAVGGIIRDVVITLPVGPGDGVATGYFTVFALEAGVLVIAFIATLRMGARTSSKADGPTNTAVNEKSPSHSQAAV
jgi:BCD family chlorophyll transporter-like MFS transporter